MINELKDLGMALLIVIWSLAIIYGIVGIIFAVTWLLINHLFLGVVLLLITGIVIRYKI